MSKKNFSRYILLLFLSIFFACDKQRVFESNAKIEQGIWQRANPVRFEVSIEDTIHPMNFYINIRHTEAYPYNNLFVFLKTRFPNGQLATDTLECVLQNKEGKWKGTGLGDIFDLQLMFKRSLRLPMKGRYLFEFEQASRQEALPMIMSIGLRIERSGITNS